MKTSYFDQYKNKTLKGALTPENSRDFYLELKELSNKYIPILESSSYTEEDADDLLMMSELVCVFLATELSNQEQAYFNDIKNRINTAYKECARIIKYYPNSKFFHDELLNEYVVSIPFNPEIFVSPAHNAWIILNKVMGSTKVTQESLFMCYLYLIYDKENSLNLKKAWAFEQFHLMKIVNKIP